MSKLDELTEEELEELLEDRRRMERLVADSMGEWRKRVDKLLKERDERTRNE